MALNKNPYKGCRDFYPIDMKCRNYLFEHMNKTAKSYGYEPYDGPMLEEVELYKAKSGEELINDQIYSFTDRGNRQVAIRPEMTPTLARMVANIHKQEAKPLRWYSIPNLMRYEKPQRGRVREHWQYNVDIFGAPAGLGELEILNVAISFLTSFGATEKMFSVLINDRSIVDGIFHKLMKLETEKAYKLYKVIDAAKKVDQAKLDSMISEVVSDVEAINILNEYLAIKSLQEVSTFITKNDLSNECENFLKIVESIKDLGLSKFIKYDPTIVRGLDYYTGLVFEVFDQHPDNRRAIAGGGAYANLLSIFNESPLAGIGFGLGDVTLKDFLETHKLLPQFHSTQSDFYLCYLDESEQSECFKLAHILRSKGLKIEMNLGTIKFNKIFKIAENKGHKIVAILEKKDNELALQIRDLKTRNTEHFKISDIDNIVKSFK